MALYDRERFGPPYGRGSPLYGDQASAEARERALRSVFIANVAFETTEPDLKAVLEQAGPVLHFRMVYDQHTGRSKGFAFCEYQDQETAQSAIRNLHDIELHGRRLKFDSAANAPDERHKGPPPMRGPIEPPVYGSPVPPQSAPEEITKAVASLPPEQMFELMKQMQEVDDVVEAHCYVVDIGRTDREQLVIKNNADEARQLLLQNPQLAYALLQAQVIMRLIDPKMAQDMLHRGGPQRPEPAPPVRLPVGRPMEKPMDLPPPPPPHGVPPPPPPQQQQQQQQPQPMPAARPAPPPQARPPVSKPPAPPAAPESQPKPTAPGAAGGGTSVELEKEQLIKQVLSLTEEQVALLPPEQKASIVMLRQQLKKQGL